MSIIGIFIIGYVLGVIGTIITRRKPKNVGEIHINTVDPNAEFMSLHLTRCELDELVRLDKIELTITRE